MRDVNDEFHLLRKKKKKKRRKERKKEKEDIDRHKLDIYIYICV
jgi:hypothetical protein